MFGNPKLERAAIESIYEDSATISRRENVTGDDHITRAEWKTICENVICALSYKGDSSRQTEAQHSLDYSRKLFVAPEVDIRPGDTIKVKRFGRFQPDSLLTEEYEVVGKPMHYLTHQEVPLKAVDLA